MKVKNKMLKQKTRKECEKDLDQQKVKIKAKNNIKVKSEEN